MEGITARTEKGTQPYEKGGKVCPEGGRGGQNPRKRRGKLKHMTGNKGFHQGGVQKDEG